MRIGETQAFLTPEEEEMTKLDSPLDIYEIDLHGLREAAVADIRNMELHFLKKSDEMPVGNVFASLGAEYETALARKFVFSKIASELALRTVIDKLLDDNDPDS